MTLDDIRRAAQHFVAEGMLPEGARYSFIKDGSGCPITFDYLGTVTTHAGTFLLLRNGTEEHLVIALRGFPEQASDGLPVPAPIAEAVAA